MIQLMHRFIKFCATVLDSPNPLVRSVSKLCIYSQSVFADNVRIVLSKLKANNIVELLQTTSVPKCKDRLVNMSCYHAEFNEEVLSTVETIKELCIIRDGLLTSNLSSDETASLLHSVSVQ